MLLDVPAEARRFYDKYFLFFAGEPLGFGKVLHTPSYERVVLCLAHPFQLLHLRHDVPVETSRKFFDIRPHFLSGFRREEHSGCNAEDGSN